MKLTIKQIARAANVSTATVSLAMNNKPGVSPTTRKRILQSAELLKKSNGVEPFTPLLRGGVRFLKIVKHGHVVNRDHDVFIAAYIEGMDSEARKHGYNLEITNITIDQTNDFIGHLNNSPSKGLVLLGTELNRDDLLAFGGVNVPMVVVDTSYDFMKLDFVDMNNTESIFQIVQFLIDNNHRDIGFIWSEQVGRNFEQRMTAFREAVKYFGLPFDSRNIISVDSTFNEAYQGVLQHLKKGLELPTALVSANDLIASACIKAFKEAGIRVPHDVSIIGFDNLPICEMLDPPLTTMNVSKRQIGETALQILIGRIEKCISAPTVKILLGGEIVARKSVRFLSSGAEEGDSSSG